MILNRKIVLQNKSGNWSMIKIKEGTEITNQIISTGQCGNNKK